MPHQILSHRLSGISQAYPKRTPAEAEDLRYLKKVWKQKLFREKEKASEDILVGKESTEKQNGNLEFLQASTIDSF